MMDEEGQPLADQNLLSTLSLFDPRNSSLYSHYH